jgi:hypothetical protein
MDKYRQCYPLCFFHDDRNLLVQTTAKTKCGESAFSVYAAKLWNKLPEEIKNAATTSIFKSKPKTKLFSDAYY